MAVSNVPQTPRIDPGAVGQADCHKDAGDGRRRNRGTAKRQRGYTPVAGELAGLAAEEIARIESQDSLQVVDADRFRPLSSLRLRWCDDLLPISPRHLPASARFASTVHSSFCAISHQQSKI